MSSFGFVTVQDREDASHAPAPSAAHALTRAAPTQPSVAAAGSAPTNPNALAPQPMTGAVQRFSPTPAFARENPAGSDATSGGFWNAFWKGPRQAPKPVTVLQIGDSHTAADFFTGEVRRILQARYGDGGPGYLAVGRPHPGLHKVDVAVSADPGWTYAGIQKSSNVDQFALSGFLATTAQPSERLGFTAADPVPYTDLEIEAEKGPDQGDIDVTVDGEVVQHVSLQAPQPGRAVIPIVARPRAGRLRQIAITTTTGRPVTILSVNCVDRQDGLSYSNVGFPGATVDILNKFPQATIVDALHRLHPDVVVLAFGTNEGFNDSLDLDRYREQYEQAIHTIRTGAPEARIVMVGPAYANRAPADCQRDPTAQGCAPAPPAAKPADALQDASAAPAEALPPPPADPHCRWPTPPQLDPVRKLQATIAREQSIAFWDWSSIMPEHCGPDAWVSATPRLMTPDHVHFTADGYRRGGKAFAAFLDPFVKTISRDANAVSND